MGKEAGKRERKKKNQATEREKRDVKIWKVEKRRRVSGGCRVGGLEDTETCWLFCLTASALSSGRAAEEEGGVRGGGSGG